MRWKTHRPAAQRWRSTCCRGCWGRAPARRWIAFLSRFASRTSCFLSARLAFPALFQPGFPARSHSKHSSPPSLLDQEGTEKNGRQHINANPVNWIPIADWSTAAMLLWSWTAQMLQWWSLDLQTPPSLWWTFLNRTLCLKGPTFQGH